MDILTGKACLFTLFKQIVIEMFSDEKDLQ